MILRGFVLLRNSRILYCFILLEVDSTKMLFRYKSFFDLCCVIEFRLKVDFRGVCYFPEAPVCPHCPHVESALQLDFDANWSSQQNPIWPIPRTKQVTNSWEPLYDHTKAVCAPLGWSRSMEMAASWLSFFCPFFLRFYPHQVRPKPRFECPNCHPSALACSAHPTCSASRKIDDSALRMLHVITTSCICNRNNDKARHTT